MEIAFHSLFYVLITWLLISSTFGDIALQPGFDQPGPFRHLPSNIQPNHYHLAYQPYQAFPQPYYGQPGQMPHNFQPAPSPSWPNPWMMGYRPYQQIGQPGLPGPSSSFPTVPNQFQLNGLNVELQRARELQQKLSAQMSGFYQSNSAQFPQQAMPPVNSNPNVPFYPFYPPYGGQPSNNLRSYRSLPILQSQGYQIIKLQDLQNAQQQRSWYNPVVSRLDSGINPQTHNSQHHAMATNSSIALSQLELNTPELNKKIDDDIVGSPLQIHRPQIVIFEQHHPVEMVNIPDDLYISDNTSKAKDDMDVTKKNSSNISKINRQTISNSSNNNKDFTEENSQKMEQEVSYVEDYTENPTKDNSEELKSQSVNQHSTYKNYAISSGAEGNDRPITNTRYPSYNGRINYNQPQVFGVGVNPQNSYIPQMDSINLQTSKMPTSSNYQSKINNDFYNSYKNYPPMNPLPLQKFPFATYNLDNSYNTGTNAVNKRPASLQSSGLSTTGYDSNWNNFRTEYYQ